MIKSRFDIKFYHEQYVKFAVIAIYQPDFF
ncbi:MAG: hypothetical protein JWP44_1824 [Mucilaginibacter sp.]|nr:hypothetical protein [Mucilaginibacter sp.]